MENQLSPIQALDLLNQAASQAPMDRKSHVMVQQAIEVLKKAIQPKEEVKEEKK